MSAILPVAVPINTPAGTDTGFLFNPGRKFRLLGVRFGSRTAITGDGTNFGVLSITGSDEATTVWEWDTDSGEDGTVAASTVYYTSDELAPGVDGDIAKDFEAAATATLLTFDADQPLEIFNDQSNGTGVAFVDAGLTLLIAYA